MKKIISLFLAFIFTFACGLTISAENKTKNEAEMSKASSDLDFQLNYDLSGAYLCEASTGKVLYAENEYMKCSPASVTKVMTLLLVCEALEAGSFSLGDTVRISDRAASMGGSQVFLREGEKITVEELIKSAVIASGNDASVALAELCAGSEGSFVKLMNARAGELGLKNTCFENSTGLDDTTKDHYSCAADIAKISSELIKHDFILNYSSLWQDSIRNGEFILTNTNRLVRYYEGCNGLKTGSTDKAGYCVSATAKRGNMQLIAVIMGAKSRDERNSAARELLDFGFASYILYEKEEEYLENADILNGAVCSVPLYSKEFRAVIDRSKQNNLTLEYEIPQNLSAPISEGESVGRVLYKIDGEQIGYSEIYVKEGVKALSLSDIFNRILKRMLCG